MDDAAHRSEVTGRPAFDDGEVDGEAVVGRLPVNYLPAIVVALFAITLLAAYGAVRGFPIPRVHDEFAYLLTGDTFLQGRLTNPTHPHWRHFDSFHVFHEPSYQAKYPPGQGAFLALGELIQGHPGWGVWIGLALALGALAWALAGSLPLPWAILGATLFLVNGRLFLKWGQSYWGGGVALLGGALFVGGLVRCWRRPAPWSAGAAGLGLLLLANSRPAEGAALGLLLLPFWWRAAWHPSEVGSGERRPGQVIGPLAVGVGLTLVLTLIYNHALTGDALRLPYVHWDKYASELESIRWYAGSAEGTGTAHAMRLVRFYFGDVLPWVLPVLLWRPDRRVLGALAVVLAFGAASWATTRAWPHYLAPVTPFAALLVVEALRRVASFGAIGRVACALLVVLHAALGARLLWNDPVANAPEHWARRRHEIAEGLREGGGEHLIFVRYGEGHSVHEEWVYNGADIDGARVVWARELEPESNAALARHFAGRRLWLVEPDRASDAPLEPVPWRPGDEVGAR